MNILCNSVVDPDPDLPGSPLVLPAGSGSRRAKMTHTKIEKSEEI
jgi:hypothetical protein